MNLKRLLIHFILLFCFLFPAVCYSGEGGPVFLKQSRFVSRAEPSLELKSMVLAFRIQDLSGLQQLLEEQQNPRSPRFHQWLTPEEFGKRFGAPEEQFQDAVRWLEQNGLGVTQAYPNRLSIYFDGTVQQVERAFKINMGTYEFQGKRFYSNDLAPRIAERFQDALAVFGLDNFPSEKPLYRSGTRTSMAPADLQSAYNLLPLYGSGIDGAGQSIAIMARSDFDVSDVQAFRSFFGLPPNEPQKIFVVPGQNPGMNDPGEVTEVLLDTEWSGAIAPRATIQVVIAPSSSSINPSLDYVVNQLPSAQVVNISFGGGEGSVSDLTLIQNDQRYMQAAAQGQSVFVASGDDGVRQFATGSELSSAPDVNRLCSSPHATCVGGTNLSPVFDGNGNVMEYGEETAWSGSGGGKSRFYAKPAYQFGPGIPNDGMRDVPDVAAMGNPAQQGVFWYQDGILRCCVGGTSLSTPLWAGLFGLVNQAGVISGAGRGGVGLANTRIYEMARAQLTSGGPQAFHDVTSGENSAGPLPGYSADVGYDQVTGWGSFDGDLFVRNFTSSLSDTGLVTLVSGVQTSAVLSPSPSSSSCTLAPSQFTLEVPPDTLQLIVTLSGSQKVSLFLRQGSPVANAAGTFAADFKAETTLPSQTIYVNERSNPPLVSGSYYVAVANCSGTQAAFSLKATLVGASTALKTEELLLDDGTMENSLSGTDLTVVNRLTPLRYPSKLKAIRIFIPAGQIFQDSLQQSIRLIAFNDPASSNRPPSSPVYLVDQWVPINGKNGYVDFPISRAPAIASGDWYIGFQYPASGDVPVALDSGGRQKQGGFLSSDNGATFEGPLVQGAGLPVNLMIRGVVENGPPILDTATATFQPDSANGVIQLEFSGRDGQGDVVGLTESRLTSQQEVLGTGSFDISTRVGNRTSFVSEVVFTGSNRLADTREIQIQLLDQTGLSSDVLLVPVISNLTNTEMNLDLQAAGAVAYSLSGHGEAARAGYATMAANGGGHAYGTGVFALTRNGVVASEVGVPATQPTTAARMFVDFRTNLHGGPGLIDPSTIDVNTGLAIVNPNNVPADVRFTLSGMDGSPLALGFGTIPANGHVARFINQLGEVARGFALPSDFPAAIQFASLEIRSSQPLGVLALRLTNNRRGDTLITSTPLADLNLPPVANPLYFPHVVNGGGYKTTLILMNTSATVETGELRIFGDDGSPLEVRSANGPAGSSFAYAIPSGGLYLFETDGAPAWVSSGSVQVIPDRLRSTPMGAGLFGFAQDGIIVTESGIPAATLTTHARIFVDRSVGHDTGLAVANPSGNPIQLKLNAFERNGVSWVGKGSLELRPAGHQSRFVGELLAGGLPDNFTGIVDISSGTPFAALTLRTLNNSRGEFLLTTFPVGDALQSPPSSLIFPQIVDGAGYQTQFILLNSGPLANIRLNLFADDGTAVLLSKAPQSEFWNLDELVFSGALEPESPSVRKSCSGTAP
ncbi:MAG: S53 family peptidase [Acidobacteriia bacterium]|nr:S53 family peptidase [Terriglobia bacterium]